MRITIRLHKSFLRNETILFVGYPHIVPMEQIESKIAVRGTRTAATSWLCDKSWQSTHDSRLTTHASNLRFPARLIISCPQFLRIFIIDNFSAFSSAAMQSSANPLRNITKMAKQNAFMTFGHFSVQRFIF